MVIVGDQTAFFTPEDLFQLGYHPDYGFFVYLDEQNDVHWYSKETGQEIDMVHYDDLRFIEMMPNLRYLTLVLVEADSLPDLSGASLLEDVQILSCNIHDISWLSGSSLRSLSVRFSPVENFGILTACKKLDTLSVDMFDQSVHTDFSDFAPPAISSLWLWHANPDGVLDLSALKVCVNLHRVTFGDLPLTDLSCIANCDKLEYLELHDLHQLRDISALSTLKKLDDLQLTYSEQLRDFSPIADCKALTYIHLQGMPQLTDASFLRDLPALMGVDLFDVSLRDMDFLEGLADNGEINLGFAGNIHDYSGLSAIKNYGWLHLNVRSMYNPNGDLTPILPYLEGASCRGLHLHDCRIDDLSRLPEVRERFEIWYGSVGNLTTLPAWPCKSLQLNDLQYLTRLDGIRNLPNLGRNAGELEIDGCPRLHDWSALDGLHLDGLKLIGVYELPSFEKLDFAYLRLDSIEGLDSLSFLNDLDIRPGFYYAGVDLVGLDALRDLTPLRRFPGIGKVTVPPHLAEQAEELVEAGIAERCEVAYPDGSWQTFEGDVELLSLEELDTLPKSLLKHVRRLILAGDQIIDPDEYWVFESWDEDGEPIPMLHNIKTDEDTELLPGALTDLSALSVLTELEELKLYCQPLTSLEGVQALGSLRYFDADFCFELTDASALFALQDLEDVSLRCSPVTSIQGVQNLSRLRRLDIFHTKVADLPPLSALDYTAALEDGGFSLEAADLPCEDFTALAAVPRFDSICLNNIDSAYYLLPLEGVEIRRISACGAHFTDDSLSRFLRAHPELEDLAIPWSQEVHDLSMLAEMENLGCVKISFDMEDAIESLNGVNYGFELIIEGQ